jgi:hypothetical protein
MAMTKTLSIAKLFSMTKPVTNCSPYSAPRYHQTQAPKVSPRPM